MLIGLLRGRKMKGALVINLPVSCRKCDFRKENKCYAYGEEFAGRTIALTIDGINAMDTNRANWCPIEPITGEILAMIENANR